MHERIKTIIESIPEKSPYGHYTIPGNPIPLARARFRSNHVYDAQKHLKISSAIYLQSQHNGRAIYTNALKMYVIFFMPIPSGSTAKKRASLLDTYVWKKPDLSNLIKFIEDTATGILYHDDRLICSIEAHKVYDYEPRTELILHEV